MRPRGSATSAPSACRRSRADAHAVERAAAYGRGAGGGGTASSAGGMARTAASGPAAPRGRRAMLADNFDAEDDMDERVVAAEPRARPAPDPAPVEIQAQAQQQPMWGDMPAPGATATPTTPAQRIAPRRPSRRPGRWMRRVWVRSGNVQRGAEPTPAAIRAADEAEARLAESPDSRDRHRDAIRRLSQAGRLDRALEIAESWIERDREDAEALTAKADILGRMGHRDEALRLLTGTVDLSPNSNSLHRRLAGAFERVGRPERACAHRIALAEIDENEPAAVAAAMRCERALGRDEAASRILYSVREARVRTRAERLARDEDASRRFRGDFTIDGEWEGGDLDISIVTSRGTRLSWMGGRTTVVGDRTTEAGRERLGLRWTGVGSYTIEVNRTDPEDTSEIRGRLAIRVLGERQTVPFTLTGERAAVARVRVTRTSRLEAVTGTVGPGRWTVRR